MPGSQFLAQSSASERFCTSAQAAWPLGLDGSAKKRKKKPGPLWDSVNSGPQGPPPAACCPAAGVTGLANPTESQCERTLGLFVAYRGHETTEVSGHELCPRHLSDWLFRSATNSGGHGPSKPVVHPVWNSGTPPSPPPSTLLCGLNHPGNSRVPPPLCAELTSWCTKQRNAEHLFAELGQGRKSSTRKPTLPYMGGCTVLAKPSIAILTTCKHIQDKNTNSQSFIQRQNNKQIDMQHIT